VPEDSPESNAGQLTALVYALGVTPRADGFFPDTALPLPAAAAAYHNALALFLEGGGCIPLGLLGLAPMATRRRCRARPSGPRPRPPAIPVQRESGPQRVSVTPDFLQQVEC